MNWKDTLKQLKHEYLKREAPDFYRLSGGEKMKLKPYNDQTANGLTRCIQEFLKLKGHACLRVNTQGQYDPKLKRFRKGGSTLGSPDLVATIFSKSVFIEVKVNKDQLREHQVNVANKQQKAGGIYYTARDMGSFIEWYKHTFNKGSSP